MKKSFMLFLCFAFAYANKASLKIGDKGPGGGTVFHKAGDRVWEVSDKLGKANWEDAKTMCKDYRGGGLSDWYLPNREDLNWVYVSLVKTGKVKDTDWYWSSSPSSNYEPTAWSQFFGYGDQYDLHKNSRVCVCAVRAF